ncbi:MAG: hypothetical protein KF683_11875 [Rubrivivax sp.]|nr:hypothetical protein [Rubrivivax sp.]
MSTITLPGQPRAATAARRGAAPVRATATAARSRQATATAAPAAAVGWLDRLAAWADAGPQHHRLGHWTRYTR